MAITPVILPGEFHGQGAGRLQSIGSDRVRHNNLARTHERVASLKTV